jgi:plasmid replication initiation protein
LRIKNFASVLIYKLLRECGDLKYIDFTIDELKQKLDLVNNYNQYGIFKLRVLKPALIDINKNTEIKLSLKEIKQQKTIVKVKFVWVYV